MFRTCCRLFNDICGILMLVVIASNIGKAATMDGDFLALHHVFGSLFLGKGII